MGIYGMIRGEIAKRKTLASEKADIKMVQRMDQLEELEKEKVQVEKREFVRKTLGERKREIREMKRAKFKEQVTSVKSGLQKFKGGVQKAKSGIKSRMGSTSGSQDVFGSGSKNVFSGDSKPKKRIIF